MAPKKKMKPTRPSRQTAPSAKPAAREENGRFRTSENENASSSLPSQKKKRRASRKSAKGNRKKGAAAHASPSPPSKQKGIDHPRLAMGDALRRAGLDEVTVAEHFAATVQKLSTKNEGSEGVAKLFVDTLKECTRHLDSPRSSGAASGGAAAASETRVIVNLIHEVARPNRPTPASIAASNAADTATVADPIPS
jgi:hypothetical protein